MPILHEFKADNVHNIVNHSDSRILFVGDLVWEYLNEQLMPELEAIILINDFSVLHGKKKSINRVRERLNEHFGQKYPKNFRPEHVAYFTEDPNELAIINYTSGTTGFSKGVMLPYRSLYSNIAFACDALSELKAGDSVVAMLPTAHMYGMSFEFLFEISKGCHVQFLTRLPTPKIILEAFAETKPRLIVTVPLIIEKIYRNSLRPLLRKPSMRALLSLPVVDRRVLRAISNKLNAIAGRKFSRNSYWRSRLQPGGRALFPQNRVALHRGLRHDGVRPHCNLRRLEQNAPLLLRTGNPQHAGAR